MTGAPFSDDTILCTAGVDADRAYGAVMPPLYLSANFAFEGYGKPRAHDYSRSGNPTRDKLAEAIAALEQGAGGVITSSGLAAVDLVLALLKPGDLVIAPHDCYGGTWRLLTARTERGAFEVLFIDQSDPEALEKALVREPALVWIETPSNPLMRIVDIESLCARAKSCGARLAVDNTFLSPVLQKPILLGADFVVHSTTKYLNGHSDVVGGAVVAAREEDAEQLKWWANCLGTAGAPFDSWLTLRGLRTLSVRVERQQETAGQIAQRLAQHPAVAKVHYPGLPSHPNHSIAAKQQRGFGAMLSFELAIAGDEIAAFLRRLKRFILAESLGGFESLIAHPATMTHLSMSAEARAQAGIGDGLFRLSIGLEAFEDLWSDLGAALDGLRPIF
ncbi:MAG TPA: cystathionine gamma-synthase [Rhizomicrobium sp.]|jgi:cystathionine gamma-synthase|nr:cystathionine gamma-synthase [Rhizomicrobium sp.]